MKLFFRPEKGAFVDAIPYYDEGSKRFYIFYLHDHRDLEGCGEGVDWDLISTTDFVHFEEHGVVLRRGDVSSPDLYVFTGSVIGAKGKYYIFYTGHNPHVAALGKPQQVILRALSDDLIHWKKDEKFIISAPAPYEKHDWRDPFVFLDERDGKYKMLLAARLDNGEPFKAGGVTAICSSDDLDRWTVEPPFWAPNRFFTHECPDFFQMGEDKYLVYSEFSERHYTRYVRSRDLVHWTVPSYDRFGSSLFYAAKSAEGDGKRYLFGWIGTLSGDTDAGDAEWGGSLSVLELVHRENGELKVRIPDSVLGAFRGEAETKENFTLAAQEKRSFEWLFDRADVCKFECDAHLCSERGRFGITVTDKVGKVNYCFVLDAQAHLIVAEKIPDFRSENRPQWNTVCDIGTAPHIVLLYEDGIAELCVNEEAVLAIRIHPEGEVGIGAFAEYCTVEWTNITKRELRRGEE